MLDALGRMVLMAEELVPFQIESHVIEFKRLAIEVILLLVFDKSAISSNEIRHFDSFEFRNQRVQIRNVGDQIAASLLSIFILTTSSIAI